MAIVSGVCATNWNEGMLLILQLVSFDPSVGVEGLMASFSSEGWDDKVVALSLP
jgi:hypothetical protein